MRAAKCQVGKSDSQPWVSKPILIGLQLMDHLLSESNQHISKMISSPAKDINLSHLTVRASLSVAPFRNEYMNNTINHRA